MQQISLLLYLFISTAHSFINIESLRQHPNTDRIGQVNLSFDADSGNTSSLGGQFATHNLILKEQREYLLLSNYTYRQTSGVRDRNAGSLHFRRTYYSSESLGLESFIQSQFNEFTRLSSRNLFGGGTRFRILSSEDTQFLYFGTGAFIEKQVRKDDTNKSGIRANIYLSYLYLLNQKINLSLTSYYQPYLHRPADLRLNTRLGLEYLISRRFSFTQSINKSYDSRPPKEIQTTDIQYRTGFNWIY